MDILNQLSHQRFRRIDDLLAFISISDNIRRTRAFLSPLRANKRAIQDSVCAKGGCGLAQFSIEMERLDACKVYAVGQNPLLA